ncbi:MAG: hypothetical protein H6837_07785 [Planctomycetes bacterium]|nr:hypothetical protein [Planctomycetota bacterium]
MSSAVSANTPEQADGGSPFPLVVTLLSTVGALLLFFSTTVAALSEQRALRLVENARQAREATLRRTLEDEARQRAALDLDLQSLMVELDHRGIFAGALLSEPPAGAVPPADPR